MPAKPPAGLMSLAREWGVQTSFIDIASERQQASAEGLFRTLKVLGALDTWEDIPMALRARQLSYWEQPLQPVIVVPERGKRKVDLSLPVERGGTLNLRLELEPIAPLDPAAAAPREWSIPLADLETIGTAELEGRGFIKRAIPLPKDLPWGYHKLSMELRGDTFQTLLLVAPRKAHPGRKPPKGQGPRAWGMFCPLHALHGQQSWGAGNLSDLGEFIEWVGARGGRFTATLPLLAAFFWQGETPSPYSPASRLFWNEMFLDAERIPDLANCSAAREKLASPAFRAEIAAMRGEKLVDYPRQMKLLRSLLEPLADACFVNPQRRAAFEGFIARRPEVVDYAQFRAVGEYRQQTWWQQWRTPLCDGEISPGDYEEPARLYHLYAQFLADEQVRDLSERAKQAGVEWYLDLPLGVHPDGYDIWRHRESFALGAGGGAPPDGFFTRGQNWGFPPLHPERMRKSGYTYLRSVLEHHLRYAGMLRIDHVMGLHRLYWVPDGMDAREGVYVSYPEEELYAVLALESHRHQARIVGENLGTVPKQVTTSLKKHGIDGMYVLQFEVRPDPAAAFTPPAPANVASLNTHDVPPFASFWQGADIDDRVDLGLMTPPEAIDEQQARDALRKALVARLVSDKLLDPSETDTAGVLSASLAALAESPANSVLVNLEDLWLETKPQNVPGTVKERPNWSRKARLSLEELARDENVRKILERVAAARKG